MNAQGETWTAEKFVSDAIVDSRMCGMSDEEIAIGERALAIVRLHPELVETLNQIVNCINPDRFRNDPIFAAIRDLANASLARAHALGSCEKRELPTTD